MNTKAALEGVIKQLRPLVREYRDDERLKDVLSKLNAITKEAPGEEGVNLGDLLEIRHNQRNVHPKDVPTPWLAKALDFFTHSELGKLLGTSRENIAGRIRYQEKTNPSKNDLFKPSKPLSDMDPMEAYAESLNILYRVANSDDPGVKDESRLRAIDSVLKYTEGQVLARLKEKFETLDALGTFIVSTLIPQANKRLRELVREIEAKVKAGEDTKYLTVDLRLILRDLIPTIPQLKERLLKENWIEDDNPGNAEQVRA